MFEPSDKSLILLPALKQTVAATTSSVVRLRLERELRVFSAVARIVYAHHSLGMGLCFVEIKPEHQSVLDEWIAGLSGERLPVPTAATVPDLDPLIEITNLRQTLNELINLMVRSKAITGNEAAALLRQLFR